MSLFNMRAFLRRLRALGAIRELSSAQINFPTETLLCRAIVTVDPFGDGARAPTTYMGPQINRAILPIDGECSFADT